MLLGRAARLSPSPGTLLLSCRPQNYAATGPLSKINYTGPVDTQKLCQIRPAITNFVLDWIHQIRSTWQVGSSLVCVVRRKDGRGACDQMDTSIEKGPVYQRHRQPLKSHSFPFCRYERTQYHQLGPVLWITIGEIPGLKHLPHNLHGLVEEIYCIPPLNMISNLCLVCGENSIIWWGHHS